MIEFAFCPSSTFFFYLVTPAPNPVAPVPTDQTFHFLCQVANILNIKVLFVMGVRVVNQLEKRGIASTRQSRVKLSAISRRTRKRLK